jgi:hypothetical protein
MKTRFVWLMIGLAFAVTLAVVVGQRLSAEAMAVMVGVVAGVAASIPTSLIVVWFATRTLAATRAAPEPPRAAMAEPRVMVMAPPQALAGFPGLAGYAPANYGPLPAMLAPRQFNVIGGAEMAAGEFEPAAEVVWPG